MDLPLLPVELWLAIFRWATVSRTTPHLSTTTYHPFHSDTLDGVDQDAIAVKHVLVRVCKQWRDIAADLLLEDIVIHQDANQLARAIRAEAEGGSRLKRVRRACFPYASCITYRSGIAEASSVLGLCGGLEVLVRPPPSWAQDLRFEFPADDCPPLPSLKRLDWWHHNDATRSGGVNSLTDVVRAAPNLEYLSVGGELCLSALQRAPVFLPSLTTLRIRRMNVLLLLQLFKWRLPSLQHIIIDMNNHQILEDFWATFGGQLKTVELGRTMKFHTADAIHDVLARCPNLEELNYHVQFTAAPRLTDQRHVNLAAVGLNAAENPFFADEKSGLWEHLDSHVTALCSPDFPALKRVVLHGEWGRLREDVRFGALVEKLREAGRVVEAARLQ